MRAKTELDKILDKRSLYQVNGKLGFHFEIPVLEVEAVTNSILFLIKQEFANGNSWRALPGHRDGVEVRVEAYVSNSIFTFGLYPYEELPLTRIRAFERHLAMLAEKLSEKVSVQGLAGGLVEYTLNVKRVWSFKTPNPVRE